MAAAGWSIVAACSGRDSLGPRDGAVVRGGDAALDDGALDDDTAALDDDGAIRSAHDDGWWTTLPLPATVPCARVVSVRVGAPGPDSSIALDDPRGQALVTLATDAVVHPVDLATRALASVHVPSDGPRSLHLTASCSDHRDGPGLMWTCAVGHCVLDAVTYARPEVLEVELRIPRRCEAAARARAPIDACRDVISAELHRLVRELAAALTAACRSAACTDELVAARRAVTAVARAPLRHTSTVEGEPRALGPGWEGPFATVGRTTAADGTHRAVLECGPDRETDGRPLACHVLVPTAAGPVIYTRDVIHSDVSIYHRGAAVWPGYQQITILFAGIALAR